MDTLKILKDSALILLVIAIIAYLAKFALNAVLANLLTKSMYGDLMLGLKTLMLASSITGSFAALEPRVYPGGIYVKKRLMIKPLGFFKVL